MESGAGAGYEATLPLGLQATESGVGVWVQGLPPGLQATESGVGVWVQGYLTPRPASYREWGWVWVYTRLASCSLQSVYK